MYLDFEMLVAIDNNNIIGANNSIPWYVPEDLKRFQDITLNNVVVMGKKNI